MLTLQQSWIPAQTDVEDGLDFNATMQLDFDFNNQECLAMFGPDTDFQPVLPPTGEPEPEDIYDGPAVDLNAMINSFLD